MQNFSQCSNTFIVSLVLSLATITKSSLLGYYTYNDIDTEINQANFSDVSHSVNKNRFPLWTWECVDDTCVPSKPSGKSRPQGLMTCNMLCATMQLWPQPTGPVSLSTAALPVRTDLFSLIVVAAPSKIVHEHISEAFHLMRDDLQKQEPVERILQQWFNVVVRVTINGSADPRMRVDTDEHYHLTIKRANNVGRYLSVDIKARSFCGARHALETFSQLVWADEFAGSLVALKAADVRDRPRFPYRGLLLDTARNYFPVGDLLRFVDAMGANKLNTLHWHATDAQSFPLTMSFAPQLASYGAYSAGAVYSASEVRAVVRRARLRGVRVLLEVDAPAHVGRAWGWGPAAGLGHLAHCIDAEPWSQYCDEPPCGQLNPRNEHVYTIIEQIYAEIIELTGVDDLFHLGGDDVSEHCWQKHFNSSGFMDLWVEFTRTALERLRVVNKNRLPNLVMMWASPLSDRIKSDLKIYVPHIGLQTRSAGWVQRAVSGLRTVLSNEDAWDFNDGLGAWYENGDGAPYNSWQRVYEHRPWVRGAADVEGGEGTVWAARLGTQPAERVWARAAALAERLWTDRAEGASRAVHARLDAHRTRARARGLPAPPLWSAWCTQHPFTCI